MTQEEKAKRYDEALKAAIVAHKDEDKHLKATLERIFPELKESEDEKTIKEIKQFIRSRGMSLAQSKVDSWLAWLEKQGEQKPADKVEPKFKIGDWVVAISSGNLFKILSVHNGLYKVLCEDGIETNYPFKEVDKDLRLWTIQDAKDGDVLANNGNIILFKQISDSARPDYKFIQSYCFALMHSFDFYLSGTYNLDDGFHPAIKEQRDTLFARMKEVGYEWDAEKKDLKKIEQSPDDDIERKYNPCYNMSFEEAQEYISNRGFDIPWTDCDVFVDFRYVTQTIANILCWADDNPNQKPAWSEEDENHVKSILSTIECCKAQFPNAQAVVEAYNADIEWLKSIRPQWKPNEEMLEALYRAIPKNVMEISEDEMLLDKLYQGLKYGRVLSEK